MTARPRRRLSAALTPIALTTLVALVALTGCAGSSVPIGSGSSLSPPSAASTASTGSAGSAASASGATGGTSAANLGRGVWAKMPAEPRPAVGPSVEVWDGTEILLVGWQDQNGGALARAYNPATRSWRNLAKPTSVPPMATLPQAVWTGREMVVLGEGISAVYSPSSNTWRPIPAAGAPQVSSSVVVWTGSVVLVWGGGSGDGAWAGGAAYDPAANTWTALPASPLKARVTSGAWTGTELIIAGGRGDHQTAITPVYADAAAYNPATRTWRVLAPMPAARQSATFTWDGSEVIVIGGQTSDEALAGTQLAFDPATNRWRALPPAPVVDGTRGREMHSAVWTGRQVAVFGGGPLASGEVHRASYGVAYDPASNSWVSLQKSPVPSAVEPFLVWSGSALVVWEYDPDSDAYLGAKFTPQG